MFNRKLKEQIEELTKRVKKLEEQNEILCFKVENPSGVKVELEWDYDIDGYFVKYLQDDKIKKIKIPYTSILTNVTIDKDCNITVERETTYFTTTTKYKLDKDEGVLIQIGETEEKPNFAIATESVKPKKEKKNTKKEIKKNDKQIQKRK